MKKILIAFVLVTSPSFADENQTILDSSLVKSTFSLMQSKHAGLCTPLTADSINWMCTGALFPATKLELHTGGCGIAVKIKCPTENATIYGQSKSVYAMDSTGVRSDIEGIDLGISFSDILISPNR